MSIPIIGDIIGEIVGIGRDWLEGRRKVKQAELDSRLRINEVKTKAQEDRLKRGQEADIAWENTSLQQSGWKDEYWTIILSIPLIMCFIPYLVPYVERGFEALEKTPLWYRYAIGVAISSAFGVRKFIDFMRIRKGN
jgi:hypothetical protein